MNILIVGCGKVGSQLSNVLSRMGHDVAVIDQNPAHFSSLADDFSGYNVTGVPIDQDVLRRGGIENCDAPCRRHRRRQYERHGLPARERNF